MRILLLCIMLTGCAWEPMFDSKDEMNYTKWEELYYTPIREFEDKRDAAKQEYKEAVEYVDTVAKRFKTELPFHTWRDRRLIKQIKATEITHAQQERDQAIYAAGKTMLKAKQASTPKMYAPDCDKSVPVTAPMYIHRIVWHRYGYDRTGRKCN